MTWLRIVSFQILWAQQFHLIIIFFSNTYHLRVYQFVPISIYFIAIGQTDNYQNHYPNHGLVEQLVMVVTVSFNLLARTETETRLANHIYTKNERIVRRISTMPIKNCVH